ncbi:MAG: phosphatase [Chitinophagaceae bacterium]|nr:phosphatase [Chitinophagaceae bacterium]
MKANISPEEYFKGSFVTGAPTVKQKLKQVKAFVFDWDGVFNDGRKNIDGHSSFSEIDSMGLNMMRFSHYLLYKQLPVVAIITGENNQLAFSFAKRENLHCVYYKAAHKEKALLHFCEQNGISPADVMFVYDDVLDLSVARLAGLRFMIGRKVNPLFTEFAIDNRLVDYITKHDGNNYAIREISEIVMAFSNNFDLAVENRMKFGEAYQDYLALRNKTATQFFTSKENQVIPG